jgi:multiple sugar transport system substrate-binding protein
MKAFFTATFCVLVLLSAVAWRIQPKATGGSKIPLVWVSDDNPTRREQIALFNRTHPQYDLRLDPANGGLEKVIVQSLAGVGPDLFDCYEAYSLAAYVKSGVAWDVTDEFAKAGIDVKRDVWSATWPCVLRDGRTYGFPTNAAVNAIWINRDLFDRAGAPYPKGTWTWERFLPVAQRLTQRDARGHIKQFGFLCDWYNWTQFVMQWGGRIYTPDGTRCVLDSPQGIAAIQFLHDLMYKYHVMPSPVDEAAMVTQGGWGSGTITFFAGGKGAMALGGRWWQCSLRSEPSLRMGVVECPYAKVHVFRGYGRATLINRNSPRRRDALEFLKYEAGKDYNDLVNHQADALSPAIRFCYTPEFLHDPAFPHETFNAVWRDVMKDGEPEDISPFVNGQAAARILGKQLDLVRCDQKPVAAALRDATRQVNEEIGKTLARDPSLRSRYRRLTGSLPASCRERPE